MVGFKCTYTLKVCLIETLSYSCLQWGVSWEWKVLYMEKKNPNCSIIIKNVSSFKKNIRLILVFLSYLGLVNKIVLLI